MNEEIKNEIQKLKKEKDAVILAHYYVDGEVQEIADYVGDSYYLAEIATKVPESTIVFCGVSFMGESAKILNPKKRVVMADGHADCPMAHMADIDRIEELRKEYDAIYIAIGAHSDKKIGIEGEDAGGVISAVEFLRAIGDGKYPDLTGKKVCVIGGGNVAMDAARCAKRMGADEVYIVYRRSEKELPARLEEIHHAKEEGVVFKFLTAPLEVLSDENFNVTGLKCQQMELGEPDASGRRRPIPVESSEFVIDLDCVIAAIGTSPNPLIRHTTPGLETNRKGCIVADDEHGITSKDGVFAGGDAVTGAATVILAMGAGKRAAAAMDEYIKNKNK